MGATVTQRIATIKQPRGGYLPLKCFTVDQLEDGKILHERENLNPGVVGTVVDNLTRLLSKPVSWSDGHPLNPVTPEEAFDIALAGAERYSPDALDIARSYARTVTELDDASIINACKLMAYDAFYRAGWVAYTDPDTLLPDENTIENIRVMVTRCTEFFDSHGPITCLGPTFDDAYTETVSEGDGDLLTHDAIWDIKTSTSKPRPRDTLQVYMYYLMGKRSSRSEYISVTKMGIFNPRLHVAYSLQAALVEEAVKNTVECEVIGY